MQTLIRLFILLFFVFPQLVVAQFQDNHAIYYQNNKDIVNQRPLNSIQLNLLGDASLFSVNYERQFLINSSFIISSKVGIGYIKEYKICLSQSCSIAPSDQYLTIPHHITGNIGKEKHFFEFGLGGTIIKGKTNDSYILYPIVGYRFLPLNSDMINFRVFGQFPFSGYTTGILFIPFGLSLGVSY